MPNRAWRYGNLDARERAEGMRTTRGGDDARRGPARMRMRMRSSPSRRPLVFAMFYVKRSRTVRARRATGSDRAGRAGGRRVGDLRRIPNADRYARTSRDATGRVGSFPVSVAPGRARTLFHVKHALRASCD